MGDLLNCNNGHQLADPKEYLNKDLFYSIISKYIINTPFKIIRVKHTSATGVGQNFLSKVLRNTVSVEFINGTKNKFSFISKIIGSSMLDQSLVDAMNIFPKEIDSYVNIVPELEKIWKDVAGVNVSFGPKLFYHELKPHNVLVFEDLNATGYKMGDRLVGLTEEQTLVVLNKISMWHAASRIYCDRHGSIDPLFRKGLFNSGGVSFMDPYYKLMYRNLIETLLFAGIDQHHMDAIKKWENHLIPNTLRVLAVDPHAFNCLNHGDLWVNNLMIRDEGVKSNAVSDIKLIDYQLLVYGSPAIDLIYFLTMSTNHELFTAKFDFFLEYYYYQLKSSLAELNYHKIPTFKEMQIAILEKSFYLTLTLIIALPTLLLDHQKHGIDLAIMQQDNSVGYELRKKMFGQPVVVDALKNFIAFFGKRGMLDL